MKAVKSIYIAATQQYFDIASRTRIQDFWIVLGGFALFAIGIIALSMLGAHNVIVILLAFALAIPTVSLAIRRFNDVGLSKSDFAIFSVAILVCIMAAIIFRAYGQVFFMAVALWFLLGCALAMIIQFCRPSR